MISTSIKLAFVSKPFVLLIFEWSFYTGFTVFITFFIRKEAMYRQRSSSTVKNLK